MKISPQLQDLLQVIGALTPGERRIIISSIKALDGLGSGARSHDWLLVGLDRELRNANLLATTLTSERLRGIAANYSRDSAEVRAFFESKVGLRSRVELDKLGRFLAKCHIRHCVDHDGNRHLGMILRQVSKIPEHLEMSFPGYLASGILMERILK